MLGKIFGLAMNFIRKVKRCFRILRVLDKKEKIAFTIFSVCALFSFVFICYNFYSEHTEIAPDFGSVYTEAVVGQPRFINPVYAVSDVDRDLLELLFSGLMKYTSNGEIVLDIADEYKIKEDGKVYEFTIKQDILWSDKEKLTADDVIFTIKTIQNSDYKSPLRANWIGVEIEKVSDNTIRFILEKPYTGFLERLTLKIMPKHIWRDTAPDSFARSPYNLNPVSCGPFKLKGFTQDKSGIIDSLVVERDQNYFHKQAWLSENPFLFFEDNNELLESV